MIDEHANTWFDVDIDTEASMAGTVDVELESVSDSSSSADNETLTLVRKKRIDIKREPQNELGFEAGHSRVSKSQALPLRERLKSVLPPEPIRSALTPPLTRRAWLEFLFIHVPILQWILSYRPSFIVNDIIAGITVAIMHIPQGLAYALLANLAPVYGLYCSFLPTIVYCFLGTSRHISVGTFAVVALMIGSTVDKILSSDPTLQSCLDLTQNSSSTGVTSTSESVSGVTSTSGSAALCGNDYDVVNVTDVDCEAEKITIAITIAMLTGVIMLAMGLLQLGFVSIFLSESLVSGYTTGAACLVSTSQLTHVLGIQNKVDSGPLQVPRTWIKSFSIITQTNVATLVIALVSMAALIGLNFLNKWLTKKKFPLITYNSRTQRKLSIKWIKWSIPIPAPLVVLIVATIISYLASFEENFDVIIVGDIPKGVPALSNPFTSYITLSLVIDSFIMAIVVYSVSISLTRKFAVEHEYAIHSNQEFIAYGIMNIIGSFFSSFTAAASLSRSLVQSDMGKTQLVGFFSSAIILAVLLWLGPLFEPLPRAVLAATIWVALWGMFKQVMHAWNYYKLSLADFLMWMVVFFATVLLGVDLGLGVGVVFSFLIIICRTILPYSSVLGQARNTEIFRNTKHFQVDTIQGVLIFRFMAPICYLNAAVFRTRLEMECDLHKRQTQPGGEQKGCLERILPPPEQCCREGEGYDVTQVAGGENELNSEADTAVEVVSDRDLRVVPIPKRPQNVRSVVIDCGPISFLDAAGVKALKQLVIDFDKCNVQVLFAAMAEENRNMMDRAKFYEVCGKEWLFPTIQDAVHHARYSRTLRPTRERETELQSLSNGDSISPQPEPEDNTTQQQQQQQQQV